MNKDQKIKLLFERFVSRSDVYATQWVQEDRGGWSPRVKVHCEHGCKTAVCPHKEFEPVTPDTILNHLQGKESIGVYQLDQKSKVKWLCFDIDYNKGTTPRTEELIEVATEIRDKLKGHDIPTLVEDSTNKGMHVWVLLETSLPAHVLFTYGRWVLKHIEVPEYMHVEVFPKQTQNSERLGNLVRLPLGIHKKSGKRTHFLHPNTLKPIPMDVQWKVLESYPLVSRDSLKRVFDEENIESSPLPSRPVGTPPKRNKVQRCLVHLLNEGAKEGLRDAGTFRLACLLRDYEIPIDLAQALLFEWNETKNSPPLEPEEITTPLESAYNNNYSPYPCTDHKFNSICTSECHWYTNKMKLLGGN